MVATDSDSAGSVPLGPWPSSNAAWFATTHWSVVLAAGQNGSSDAASALEALCRAYWRPLYAYARRLGCAPQDAQDLIQGFFAQLLARNSVGQADPERGRFRNFLLKSLKYHLAHERDRGAAAKRGGGQPAISLDEATGAPPVLAEPPSELTPDKAYDRQWALTVLTAALDRLEKELTAAGKGRFFARLKEFLTGDSGEGDYQAAATELGLTPNAAMVAVHRLRQRYRGLVREEIAQTVGRAEDIEAEMQALYAALRA